MNAALKRLRTELRRSLVPFTTADGRPYSLGRTPVTVSQYTRFLKASHARNQAGGMYRLIHTGHEYSAIIEQPAGTYRYERRYGNNPVTLITFEGARRFCDTFGLRLPTSAEWEWAAQGGEQQYRYPWGNGRPNSKRANYDERVGATTPVGTYPIAPSGLYDLAGNVSEWCADGPPGSHDRITQGGNFRSEERMLRIAPHKHRWERLGSTTTGFRVAGDA